MKRARAPRPKRWNIANARRQFSAVMRAAAHEPQAVYRRNRLAGVVISPDMYDTLRPGGRGIPPQTLAEAFAELREICRQERYTLRIPPRCNRPSDFPPEE